MVACPCPRGYAHVVSLVADGEYRIFRLALVLTADSYGFTDFAACCLAFGLQYDIVGLGGRDLESCEGIEEYVSSHWGSEHLRWATDDQ